jgi:hypothetical protein
VPERDPNTVAAGLEEKPWSLEQVVEMTEAYCRSKKEEVTLAL